MLNLSKADSARRSAELILRQLKSVPSLTDRHIRLALIRAWKAGAYYQYYHSRADPRKEKSDES